jgi:hypothetical protein
VPTVMVFGFTGQDASGQKWSQQIAVPFDAASTTLTVGGVANAASYQQLFAPGMLLYVAGTQLSPDAQIASAVPFLNFMGDVSASINGLAAPLYYVSPTQLDIQITGQGAVLPAAPTGTAPAANTPLSQLPAPVLPLSVTVGGTPAQVLFVGIPPGLVGVTQVNFQIPANAQLGPQPVVVTVGTVPSMPVTLTVRQ